MPNTAPPMVVDSMIAHPVHPAGHGEPAYTAGDPLPAMHDDGARPSLSARTSSHDRSRSATRKDKDGSASRDSSHARGMSRIRAAIREIVNDPFFHRPSKAEAADQDAELKRIIHEEISAARRSTEAGDMDRAISRSRSRMRSPLASQPSSRPGSQPGSRSQSRVRQVFDGLVQGHMGGHADRGAAGFGRPATKDEPAQE
ncbi:hypothetical protein JCM10207_002139 [Rhodosporidiobolus poonsookiae]